ncbi:MAG: hypothetical protein KVP17_003069 [Porospora cf. gigantea B]|uniref:uncharacterized protein n=1 Tax=Porospora cf. gigantea B TaxID=2853592 RepID=UPI003571B2E1|nr:MAG: hypothetical protein KVP17_003069 [Porospora cf. gigantea B]
MLARRDWFRHAKNQVTVVALLAFCGPGMFNALSGLGAAGSNDPAVAAIMNSLLYGFFTVIGYFSGAFFNVFGPRVLFLVGGLSYAVYALAAFYSDHGYWVGVLGGIVLGIGAGLFWTAQSAIMMAYSTPNEIGRFISVFWVVFNFGGVFGGLLTMALNWDAHEGTGAASPTSFFVFIGFMVLGAIASIFVLANPGTVVKSDGSSVEFEKAQNAKQEIIAAGMAIMDPFVLKMLPYFFVSNWFYTFEFNGFNNMLFNVRTRGLNSGLFWASQMLGASMLGKFIDYPHWPMQKRGRVAWAFNVVLIIVSFGIAIILEVAFKCGSGLLPGANGSGWDKGEGVCLPKEGNTGDPWCADNFVFHEGCDIDMGSNSGYVGLLLSFMLMGFQDAVFQSFCYWLMSAAAGNSISRNVKYAACYKGVQSLGSCVVWATDLSSGFKYRYQVGLGAFLALFSAIPVWFALEHVQYDEEDVKVVEAESSVNPWSVNPPEKVGLLKQKFPQMQSGLFHEALSCTSSEVSSGGCDHELHLLI